MVPLELNAKCWRYSYLLKQLEGDEEPTSQVIQVEF